MAGLPGLTGLTANSLVSMRELRELNEALRANGGNLRKANVGYPGAAIDRDVGFSSPSGSEIAPLVPQSIQNTLDSATFTMKHIVYWKNIPKVPVTSTLHESNVINEHGAMDMDPFIAEGAGGTTSEASYERKVVRVKYLAEKIELSDVATMVGITGVDRSALAQRTLDGTQALIGKLERNLFHADSQFNSLAFDGLYKQLVNPSYSSGIKTLGGAYSNGKTPNYTNSEGAATSPQQLQEVLGSLLGQPNFSSPNMIMCEPRVYQSLVNIATSFGRHDQLSVANSALTFGAKDLSISGPTGPVPVVPCPFLQYPEDPNTVAQGTAIASAPAEAAYGTPVVAAGGAASLFKSADVGFYQYKFVPVSNTGIGAPVALANAVNVDAAGKKVTITVDDDTLHGDTDTAVKYYRVYRSAKFAAAADAESADGLATCKYIGTYPAASGASDTVIVDLNQNKPGSSQVYVMQMDPSVMYWAQLLDFTRRPLAQQNTTIPFLLMMFGSLHVKVPTKCHVIDNVGFTL